MKRRAFLKRVAGISAVTASGLVAGCSNETAGRIEIGEPMEPPRPLKKLENEHIRFVLNSDASAEILDKASGTMWRMGRVAIQEYGPIDEGHVWLRTNRSFCEGYPARFRGQRLGDLVRFQVLGRQNVIMGTFICDVTLEGPWLEFTLSSIDEKLPSLVFPTAIESQQLVFPRKLGQLVREPLDGRYFWTFFSHLNMRWFGGLKGDAGWMAVFNKEFADAGVMAQEMTASPTWLKSLSRWRYPRTIRYRFTQGGYVGIAKEYRKWAMANGLHRSITEKTAANPALAKLRGSRLFSIVQACTPIPPSYYENRMKQYDKSMLREKPVSNISHREAAALIADAKKLGMKKGLVLLRGWINGGYDWSHVDVWPPEPALGTIDELRKVCTGESDIVVGLHDNYQDMYEHTRSFPKGIIRLADGRLMPGGYWAGGQAYIINSRDSVEYLKRNWKDIATLNPGAMFIDTTTVVQAYESYEKGNTLTRSQDLEYKQQLLKFCNGRKVLIGSEGGADFGMPFCDFHTNWHQRQAGESVPVWPIVYGDAAYYARLRDNQFCIVMNWKETEYPWWLEDMLWGYMAYFGVDCACELGDRAHEFKSTLHVDSWHTKVGGRVMTDHRFLADDNTVEQTTFDNGEQITVNFSRQERKIDGVSIPGHSYVIAG